MSTLVAIQQVLPFGENEETSSVIEELIRVCREHPLEEKILVAPALLIGYQIVEAFARSGQPWVNLRVETVRTLAHAAIGPSLAREGWKLLSRAQSLALIEQACAEALGEASYFGRLADRPGLHRSLQRSFDELRSAGLSAETLPEGAFSDRRKHRELREILRRYTAALEAGRSVDGIEVLRRARAAVESAGNARLPATYLVADSTELSALERAFLEKLAAGKLVTLGADSPQQWKRIAGSARLFRAMGEENEVREVFRLVLGVGIPFDDVEILYTDPAVYPSTIWELSREHDIPCTFASGIAVSYTRPGQTALAFLDWIAQDFAAEVLRGALDSGALTFSRLGGDRQDEPGPRAAAQALREAGIGWTRERNLRCLDRLVAGLEKPEERPRADIELTDEQRARRGSLRPRRLLAARRARDFIRRAVALAPSSSAGSGDLRSLAGGARTFVAEFGHVADELDGAAATALDVLFEEFGQLPPLPLTAAAAVERLRDAVVHLSVAPDRPRPGRMHAAFYRAGGFSGRRHTFVVGLDEARLPGSDLEDPVLLDEERRRINEAEKQPLLALGRERPRESAAAFRACIARLRGELTASYSSFDLRKLSQAGEPAPSPVFLDLYRARSGRPNADYRDLSAALPRAAGFVPEADAALDETEWWLARLRQGFGGAGAAARDGSLAAAVCAVYPWLEDGRRAERARAGEEFTSWDGWIPSGTPELDPRAGGEPFSASRIESLASCPFAYFVRHVLHVEAPEEVESDPTRWLSPRDQGTLLHEVFRGFFERITGKGEKPQVARHLDLLLELAEEEIAAWRKIAPPRSELAFAAQCETILFACRTLLEREEEHCRDVTPRYFEVSFGLTRQREGAPIASPEPVSIEVGPHARFRLRGSIDRVDEAADGTFHIWDYKTGGAWKVREGRGVRGGRQIQPELYAMAFEALLDRSGRPGKVSTSGYFFPGRKGEGQRIAPPLDSDTTRRILDRLFDLLRSGIFPHSPSADECNYCQFAAVCGGAEEASARAKEKLSKSTNPVLVAFRKLHAEETD